MLFAYKAIRTNGQRVSGQIEANNTVDLEIRLKTMDIELIRSWPSRNPFQRRGHKIPRRELINFCFHLEQLYRAGIPLLDSLADLRDAVEETTFRAIIASLASRIEGGETLSQAMAAHPSAFNAIFVNLIHAGESSGRLPEILGQLTESLKWEDELAAQTKKLLLYPAFVGSIVLTVSLFLMVFMVPQLKLFVKNMGETLPLQTRLLFFISDSLVAYGLWLIPPLLLAAIALPLLLPHRQAAVDALKLRLPLIGPILQKIILARFAGLFAMLYAAGIPVLAAIATTRQVTGNQRIARALEEAEQGINDGRSLSMAFADTALFPPLILRMLRVGENSGQLDTALHNVAYFYHRDIKEAVGKVQTLIEPALTLLLGALLGWIMLAVIGPIYDVISRIKP